MEALIGAVVVGLLLWGLIAGIRGRKAKLMACTRCHTVAEPATAKRGSLGVEVALWLLLLIPGLIYSLWRNSTRHEVCRSCGSDALVPPDSPAGREIAGIQS